MVDHETAIPDLHIPMRHIKIMFEDSRHDFETQINGTREEIIDYYNRRCDVGAYPVELFKRPTRIEFYDDNQIVYHTY